MIVGYHKLYVEPRWKLGNNIIENVSSMDILGVAFTNNLRNSTHVNNRIQKCYWYFSSLRNAGFSYSEVHSDVKSYRYYVENNVSTCLVVWIGLYQSQ